MRAERLLDGERLTPVAEWSRSGMRIDIAESPRFDTSPRTAVTLFPICFTATANSGSRRPAMKMYAPSLTNCFAVARPIPLLPPVTSPILP